ncbi:hypothetical protein GCM10028816_53580 [Spirosoma lituiforme]
MCKLKFFKFMKNNIFKFYPFIIAICCVALVVIATINKAYAGSKGKPNVLACVVGTKIVSYGCHCTAGTDECIENSCPPPP